MSCAQNKIRDIIFNYILIWCYLDAIKCHSFMLNRLVVAGLIAIYLRMVFCVWISS